MSKDLPKLAPTTEKEVDVNDSIRALEARLSALENKPHVGSAEYHSIEADPSAAGVQVNVHHSLGRVPAGAIYIAMGVPGESSITDVTVTLSRHISDDKVARIYLRRMVGVAGTTRTYHILLF